MEEKLWEYIDDVCTDEEKTAIRKLVETDQAWKSKHAELMQVHDLLHQSTLDEPSLRFTQNVMEEITRTHIAPAARTYIDKRVIYGIGGFFLSMIAGLLIYVFGQIDWSVPANGPSYSTQWKDAFSHSIYFNIFMMINVVLALMLLDKYLATRKTKASLPKS